MRQIIVGIFGLGCILAGCATANEAGTPEKAEFLGVAKFENDPRLGERVSSACFPRQIRRFRETTEDTVVVIRSPRIQYVLEIEPICIGLERAKTVALISRSSTCLQDGDTIFVSEFVTSLSDNDFTTGRCRIRSIYKWNPNAINGSDSGTTEPEDGAPSSSQETN